MATTKPRITISLSQDVYETIKGLAQVQERPMSALISEFLETVNPVQKRVLEAIKRAQGLSAESKASMVASLEAGEAQLTEMLGPLMDLMDQTVDGVPPASTAPQHSQKASSKRPAVVIDADSWQQGFDDAKAGIKSSPRGDNLSYYSGYIEGK